MKVICKAYRATDTNGFTHNKVYEAKLANKVSDKLYRVLNNNGHERFIILNQACPHLIRRFRDAYGQEQQVPIGWWEIWEEDKDV